jgi:diguanylate cyclase (GGDEF)-like protein/PAS domain S-box-containing protein
VSTVADSVTAGPSTRIEPARSPVGARFVEFAGRLSSFVHASHQTRLSLILAAEWLALLILLLSATPVPALLSAEVAFLLTIAGWWPVRTLIFKPIQHRLAEAEQRLLAHESIVAEREMMTGILEESETRLRAMFNSSPDGYAVLDPESTCPIDFNDTLPRLLGYSRTEFSSLPLTRYIVDDAHVSIRAHIDQAVRGTSEHLVCQCRTRTGGILDISFAAQPVTVGGAAAVSCIIRDVSQEREADRALRLTHDKMQTMISELESRNIERTILTEMGGVLQACVTVDEAFAGVSRFCTRLFPETAGALYVYNQSRNDMGLAACWGLPAGDFADAIEPADCWGLRQGHPHDHLDTAANLACRHVGSTTTYPYLCIPLTAQGETMGVFHLRLPAERAAGAVASVNRALVTAVCDQVTLGIANLRLRDTLRQQSIHDALTGLFNRRFMEESLRREVARASRTDRPLAVVMADLDHFKIFNDTYGHEAGDAVLADVGHMLKRSVRASDLACRYGGEEFTLVMPDTTVEATLERVEGIRARVSQMTVLYRQGVLGGLTLSLGVALFPDHGTSSEDLLRAADKALYRAKQAGRNRALVAGDNLSS